MGKRRAFTLIEILLAITVIAVFFGLIFAFYKNAINKSKYVEAVATVANIAKTEEIVKLETGEYVAAANTQEVNERLGMDIEPRWFNYKVVGVTNDNFIVLAERIRDDIESGDIAGDDIVVARNNTGPISPDSVNPAPPDLGGDDIGGPDTGDSTPPGSGSPGGGSPGGGGAPGGSGDSGDTSPTGGGSDDSIRHPTQTAVPSSVLDYLSQAPLAADRLSLINDNNIRMVYVDNADYGVPESYVAFWWGINDHIEYDSNGNQVFVTGNTMFVNQNATATYTEAALAAIIAHEATHADYDYNPQEWIDATKAAYPIIVDPITGELRPITDNDIHITQYPGNSIDQEYNANEAMVELWNVVKDSENSNLDFYAAAFATGEDNFKTILKAMPAYSALPDY